MRLLPIAALTSADLLERKYGWKPIEDLLSPVSVRPLTVQTPLILAFASRNKDEK